VGALFTAESVVLAVVTTGSLGHVLELGHVGTYFGVVVTRTVATSMMGCFTSGCVRTVIALVVAKPLTLVAAFDMEVIIHRAAAFDNKEAITLIVNKFSYFVTDSNSGLVAGIVLLFAHTEHFQNFPFFFFVAADPHYLTPRG
jgi:hypothetical protein